MHIEPRAGKSCGYENELVEDEVLRLRRELNDAYALIAEKDQRIKKLLRDQKSADEDLHALTEQLFQQAYKLVNDEKKRSIELKMRLEMLEAENKALKTTVRSHKRPMFSPRSSPATVVPTPTKLSKTPIRSFFHRYSTLLTDDSQSSLDLSIESPARFTAQHHSGRLEVFDVDAFARILTQDLKPRALLKTPPCLPAYLLLASFRHLDASNKTEQLTFLFDSVNTHLKRIAVESPDDFDVQAIWLVNTWRLWNLLRQYGSNSDEWAANGIEQQDGSLRLQFNFDSIRNELAQRVEDFYRNFMRHAIEPVLTPKIFPGILQHESTSSLTSPANQAQRWNLSHDSSTEAASQSLEDMLAFLSIVHSKLEAFGADHIIYEQVFDQISKWICAHALGQLVVREDLCTFDKAIQIKHNVMELTNWLAEHQLHSCKHTLEPLIQASHLMQSRKDESNLETLCGEMTSRLSPKQIISLLQNYTSHQGLEEHSLDSDFIAKLSTRLSQRADFTNGANTMNGTSTPETPSSLRPFDTQRFIHSTDDLHKLTLPTCLRLDSVARLI